METHRLQVRQQTEDVNRAETGAARCVARRAALPFAAGHLPDEACVEVTCCSHQSQVVQGGESLAKARSCRLLRLECVADPRELPIRPEVQGVLPGMRYPWGLPRGSLHQVSFHQRREQSAR